MSQPNLNEDLNVIANSSIEITYMDGDLNIIQALDDEPNDVGGLTSAQLKAKFDEAGNTIKEYINETLLPGVKNALNEKADKSTLNGIVLGQIPDRSITKDKLSEGLVETLNGIVDAYPKPASLSASTAALYGLGADAVPDDVLGVLSRFHNGLGIEYVWEKEQDVYYPAHYEQGTSEKLMVGGTNVSGSYTYYYSDSISLANDGTVSLVNPSNSLVHVNQINGTQDVLLGKYFQKENTTSPVYFCPPDCTLSKTSSGSYNYVYLDTVYKITGYAEHTDRELIGYVNSPDPSAYPPDVSDGYTYRELGQIGKKLSVYNIREITTGEKASTIEVDISDLDLNEWEFLVAELVPSSGNGMGTWWAKGTGLSINDMHYTGMGDLNSTAGLGPVSDFSRNKRHTYMVLMLHKNKAQDMKALTFSSSMAYGRSSNYTFEPVTSLVIASTSTDYYLNAGTKIYLWGVR